MTHFGGRGRAPRGFWSTPICQLGAPGSPGTQRDPPTGRPTALPPLRAGHRQCEPLGESASGLTLQRASANQSFCSLLSSVREAAVAPTEAHLSHRPVTFLIGDHFRLPWTYSPPQTHPPDLISHPVLFWRLASLTGGRSRSFLLFFFSEGGFPYPGSGHVPSFR